MPQALLVPWGKMWAGHIGSRPSRKLVGPKLVYYQLSGAFPTLSDPGRTARRSRRSAAANDADFGDVTAITVAGDVKDHANDCERGSARTEMKLRLTPN